MSGETFWEDVHAAMSGDESQVTIAEDAERLAGTLTDGLNSDEDWTHVL
jgi:hypothetical protein